MILCGAGAFLCEGCTDEEILLVGPAGTGKTVAACNWLIDGCLRWPGSHHLLARDIRSSMTETTLITMESVIDVVLMGAGNREINRVTREQRHSYRINGSEIVVAGLDEATKAFGSAWGRVVVDEAIEVSLETWELFGRSARDPRLRREAQANPCPHQRCAVTNPGNPEHWLNRRATREPPSIAVNTRAEWERLVRYCMGPQPGQMRRLIAVHQDNPDFFDHEKWEWTEKGLRYLVSLNRMSGYRRARMLEGRWVTGVGDPVFDPESLDRIEALAAAIEKERPTLITAGTIQPRQP